MKSSFLFLFFTLVFVFLGCEKKQSKPNAIPKAAFQTFYHFKNIFYGIAQDPNSEKPPSLDIISWNLGGVHVEKMGQTIKSTLDYQKRNSRDRKDLIKKNLIPFLKESSLFLFQENQNYPFPLKPKFSFESKESALSIVFRPEIFEKQGSGIITYQNLNRDTLNKHPIGSITEFFWPRNSLHLLLKIKTIKDSIPISITNVHFAPTIGFPNAFG